MKLTEIKGGYVLALFVLCLWLPGNVHAQTVFFSTSDPGQVKAITDWGADTAWPSRDNMRISIAHMGVDEIDIVRLNFYMDAGSIRSSHTS